MNKIFKSTIKGINCNAKNCVYNENNLCTAKSVDVGPRTAVSSSETMCATFRAKIKSLTVSEYRKPETVTFFKEFFL